MENTCTAAKGRRPTKLSIEDSDSSMLKCNGVNTEHCFMWQQVMACQAHCFKNCPPCRATLQPFSTDPPISTRYTCTQPAHDLFNSFSCFCSNTNIGSRYMYAGRVSRILYVCVLSAKRIDDIRDQLAQLAGHDGKIADE